MNEHAPKPSPTKTKGESTSSQQIGDNTRKGKEAKDSFPYENMNHAPVDLPGKGTRMSQAGSPSSHAYVNSDVLPTGKPTSSDSLHRDENSSAVQQSEKKLKKPQSPPNPFIFPSTFQGSMMDAEFRTFTAESTSLLNSSPNRLTSSQPTQQNHTGDTKLRNNNIVVKKQGDVSEIPDDDDLRPEVAKLPGRKRVASWGTLPDEVTPVSSEPSKDSLAPTESNSLVSGQLRHPVTNGYHTNSVTSSENATIGNNAGVQTRVNLMHSETSSPSESRRGSVSKNRKSWDGVRHPAESEENQKVSHLERPKDNKERSCSDSNLMVRNIQFVFSVSSAYRGKSDKKS